jgi:hypothetical protein
MESLAVERLEMILEQVDEDPRLLVDGDHVSGPSVAEYRTRVERATRFRGRVVNQPPSLPCAVCRRANASDPAGAVAACEAVLADRIRVFGATTPTPRLHAVTSRAPAKSL